MKKSYKDTRIYNIFIFVSTVQACGPVRPDSGSPIEEIVVLVEEKAIDPWSVEKYEVYIFNIAHSYWRPGELPSYIYSNYC